MCAMSMKTFLFSVYFYYCLMTSKESDYLYKIDINTLTPLSSITIERLSFSIPVIWYV